MERGKGDGSSPCFIPYTIYHSTCYAVKNKIFTKYNIISGNRKNFCRLLRNGGSRYYYMLRYLSPINLSERIFYGTYLL